VSASANAFGLGIRPGEPLECEEYNVLDFGGDSGAEVSARTHRFPVGERTGPQAPRSGTPVFWRTSEAGNFLIAADRSNGVVNPICE
jgi:hypothetical protein